MPYAARMRIASSGPVTFAFALLVLAACGPKPGAKGPNADGPHECAPGSLPDCQKQCEVNKNGPSCFQLGSIYQKSPNPADIAKASFTFDAGCNLGNSPSCTAAGRMYADGAGVAPDDFRAFAYFQRGCDAKDPEGCVEAGVRLAEGKGATEDDVKAKQLFVSACEELSGLGCYWRGVTFEQGIGEEKNDEMSVAYFDRSCYLGSMKGCASLGNCYVLGIGVDEDFDKGLALLDKACKNGNQWACTRLQAAKNAGGSAPE